MTALNIDAIARLLPHRYPMLLVDRVIECDDKERIVAIKNVTANEPFFQGHFPAAPIMPGVLQIEAMAQTGGILVRRLYPEEKGVPIFLAIEKAKFRKPVRPGDQLRIEVAITQMRKKVARFSARILVDGTVVSEGELLCMFTDQSLEA